MRATSKHREPDARVTPPPPRRAVRRVMVGASLLLAVTAFGGSFTHVHETVAEHGQSGWISWAIAAMPELMVLLCVMRVREGSADIWTWATAVSAVGFTLAANLAQAEPSWWGFIAAGWPAWAAVASVKLLESGDPAEVTVDPVVEVKPQVRRRVKPAPAVTPSPPGPDPVTPEPIRPHLVQGQDDLAEWVKGQRAEGARRADVIREAVTRYGVSESTVIRRWKEAA